MVETNDVDKREEAVKRLKEKSDFRIHLFSYVAVNTMFIVIWAFMGAGFFWPIFVVAGWGIGVLIHAYAVYAAPRYTEAQIQREMKHLNG